MIKVCHMLSQSGKNMDAVLLKTKHNCLHSEPNYGVLWFYFKNSSIDSAYEIWHCANSKITKETNSLISREI